MRGRFRVAGGYRKVTRWPGRQGQLLRLRQAEHGPSAGECHCQHKLTQVVLAPGLEQHGAVFSFLCLKLLCWDNVRFLILYAEGRKNATFFLFFFLYSFFCQFYSTYLYVWRCYKARSANALFWWQFVVQRAQGTAVNDQGTCNSHTQDVLPPPLTFCPGSSAAGC